jgi:hypothetical protein
MHGISVLLAALGCAACAEDKTETVDGGLGYAIEFPSKQAAIASDSLKIYVFGSDQDCLTLMQNRRSGGQLPAAVAETQAAPVCDYLSGSAGGDITLDPGDYVVFAVAQRENKDFLLGCAKQSVSSSVAPEPVNMSLADETSGVPATTCNLLADKCGGKC